MEFVDSLKRWFFNNNSSAASSDARVPLLNANGTPKGSDTMANLASVLGVSKLVPSSYNVDLDLNSETIAAKGITCFRAARSTKTYSEINFPINCTELFGLCIVRDSLVYFQIVCCDSDSRNLYFRTKWGTWGTWKKFTLT